MKRKVIGSVPAVIYIPPIYNILFLRIYIIYYIYYLYKDYLYI